MFRSSGSGRRRTFGGTCVALAAACAVFAAPAQAVQTSTLNYMCKYPILGVEPLSLAISIDMPDTWPSYVETPPFAISVVATAGGDTAEDLQMIDGLTSIEGQALAYATVFRPEGGSQQVTVPIAVENYAVPTPTPDPLVLNASGMTPSFEFDELGMATFTLDTFALNLTVRDSFGDAIPLPPVTRDIDRNPVSDSDGDPNTFDVYCKLDAGQAPEGQSPVIAELELPPECSCEYPPRMPREVDFEWSDFGPTSINVRWGASSDDRAVADYVIRYEGEEVRVPATGGSEYSQLIDGLGPDSEYYFEIVAVDVAGNESEPLQLLLITSDFNQRPAQVTGVVGTPAETSVALSWNAATDGDGAVARYNVYNGATKVATVTDTSATVTGLTAGTQYVFQIEAVDNLGLAAVKSAELTIRTTAIPAPPIRYGYMLKGSTLVKTLTKGTLPLNGSIDAQLSIATGAIAADLTLADTQGRLTALGFLPVTAKIGFVPSGKTTGTLLDGVLKTKSLVRIKVKEVKLFGAIPLAGGNNCQTKQLSEINLQSTDAEFKPLQGGPIAGTYRISDLNGCGVLNGLVSPLTAGAGNTINLTLAPNG